MNQVIYVGGGAASCNVTSSSGENLPEEVF